MTDRFGELTMPLTLLTSRQDHVVSPSDSEHLAGTYGGSVEHVWLERSFHVATKDYERDICVERTLAVLRAVASSAGGGGFRCRACCASIPMLCTKPSWSS